MTEAAILLDEPYTDTVSRVQLTEMLERLCELSKSSVITGARLDTGEHANALMLRGNSSPQIICWDPLPASYPGTGDIFASVMTGRLMLGDTFARSVVRASDFVRSAVAATIGSGQLPRNGVCFEPLLSSLGPAD